MKKIHKRLRLLGSASLFMLATLFTAVQPVFAAGAALTMSPSSSSVQNGNTVTVTVGGSSGSGTADGANITLSYDATKLSYVSLSTSSGGTPLTSGANYSNTVSGSTGTIAGGAYASPAVSGNIFLLSVTFKALANSGSTALQFLTTASLAYPTELDSGGSSVGAVLSGTTISFTTPVCPSGYTGTYPNCTPPPPPTNPPPSGGTGGTGNTGSGGSTNGNSDGNKTPTPPPTTPAPTTTLTPTPTTDNSGISLGDKTVEYSAANFTVTTKTPTQVYIHYGLSGKALTNSTQPDALGIKHVVVLDPKLLVPGQTYYYTVVSKDAQGVVTQTRVASFTTKGLTLSVGVFDKNHQPLRHKLITLHSNPATATTDDKGYAVFSNVIPGAHHVVYTADKKDFTQPIAVVNNVVSKNGVQSAPTQNFSVVYGLAAASKVSLLPLTIASLLVLSAGVFYLLRKPRHAPAFVADSVATAASSGVLEAQISTIPQINKVPSVSTPEPVSSITPESGPLTSQIDSIQGPTSPQPGSMIMPKDDADSEDQPKSGI